MSKYPFSRGLVLPTAPCAAIELSTDGQSSGCGTSDPFDELTLLWASEWTGPLISQKKLKIASES